LFFISFLYDAKDEWKVYKVANLKVHKVGIIHYPLLALQLGSKVKGLSVFHVWVHSENPFRHENERKIQDRGRRKNIPQVYQWLIKKRKLTKQPPHLRWWRPITSEYPPASAGDK